LEFCVSSQIIQFCGLKRMQIEKFFAEHSFFAELSFYRCSNFELWL
jgi:hypothetical protein